MKSFLAIVLLFNLLCGRAENLEYNSQEIGKLAGQSGWQWEKTFSTPQRIQFILQINGNHAFVYTNAPSSYKWFSSPDGTNWQVLPETSIVNERRRIRLIKFNSAMDCKAIRIKVSKASGSTPFLSQLQFFEKKPLLPHWALVVNTTEDCRLPGHGSDFIPLAQTVEPGLLTQQINLEEFTPGFVEQEPKPICAFLSGNFKDWCEVDRERWRGTQEVLRKQAVPMWASCGGAQGLAILATAGVDQPWDCPHCRNPEHPLLPVYTHIGHTGRKECGDYSSCIFERGAYKIKKLKNDVVFNTLPEEFQAMESHCGQIEFIPAGWELIATAGTGTTTKMQCMKLANYPIYAAQFHIEMSGTPDVSREIMKNFLSLVEHPPQP